jgi:hypothetical protein
MNTPEVHTKPRPEVIEDLIALMLDVVATPMLDATSGEIASAIFTLCARVVTYSMEVKDYPSRVRNIETARTAIGQLYSLLPAPTSLN